MTYLEQGMTETRRQLLRRFTDVAQGKLQRSPTMRFNGPGHPMQTIQQLLDANNMIVDGIPPLYEYIFGLEKRIRELEELVPDR